MGRQDRQGKRPAGQTAALSPPCVEARVQGVAVLMGWGALGLDTVTQGLRGDPSCWELAAPAPGIVSLEPPASILLMIHLLSQLQLAPQKYSASNPNTLPKFQTGVPKCLLDKFNSIFHGHLNFNSFNIVLIFFISPPSIL